MARAVLKMFGSRRNPATNIALRGQTAGSEIGYKRDPSAHVGIGTQEAIYTPWHQKVVAMYEVVTNPVYAPGRHSDAFTSWDWYVEHIALIPPIPLEHAPRLTDVCPDIHSRIHQGVSYLVISDVDLGTIREALEETWAKLGIAAAA